MWDGITFGLVIIIWNFFIQTNQTKSTKIYIFSGLQETLLDAFFVGTYNKLLSVNFLHYTTFSFYNGF